MKYYDNYCSLVLLEILDNIEFKIVFYFSLIFSLHCYNLLKMVLIWIYNPLRPVGISFHMNSIEKYSGIESEVLRFGVVGIFDS